MGSEYHLDSVGTYLEEAKTILDQENPDITKLKSLITGAKGELDAYRKEDKPPLVIRSIENEGGSSE